MENVFLSIHSKQFVEGTLDRIKSILFDLYGSDKGENNFTFLVNACKTYLASRSTEELARLKAFDPARPYDHLKGKIFAISYPDNIYTHEEPTLKTLSQVLEQYFPGINGIHILPEREMSHDDVWPQDFFPFLQKEDALALVEYLKKQDILDSHGRLTEKYETIRHSFCEEFLSPWLEFGNVENIERTSQRVRDTLDGVFNSHFNDGGFSQKTRENIDPRFGTLGDLKQITSRYAVMLDYVVNHLDIDNVYLEGYRRRENSGDAFIIIDPVEYEEIKDNGSLARTFRPRPFPLYTGVRKYPENRYTDLSQKAAAVNKIFIKNSLDPLDERIILFLSIYFKIHNDQGLTAEDTRIFAGFIQYLNEQGIAVESIFTKSAVQPSGRMFVPEMARGLSYLITALGVDPKYGLLFTQVDDEIFGEKFFVYTTFSESQVDINPVSETGFKMIIEDLFHLLSSGHLAMMRMDAIKYLWKEKGKKNFDMEEGNKLIEVIRRVMQLTAPGVLPLDEVNSPDPVVYKMEKGGGFAYLFGQVNATVCAFNEGSLEPIERYYTLFRMKRPEGFVPFIMLSTHDGRSVQGLGVQRTDGHVSIDQFYRLKETIEQQGGRAKYRSVPVGKISKDTFHKVVEESGLSGYKEKLLTLFTPESVKSGENYTLPDSLKSRNKLLEKMAVMCGKTADDLSRISAVQYFIDWIVDGRTVYELCATTRSSLSDGGGTGISAVAEARRLALAQAFVLTFGQAVPAVYFNDLLGLVNDEEGFKLSGKPRDLNRHKSFLPDLDLEKNSDPFRKEYIPLINTLLRIRGRDDAFYPGSRDFEFRVLTDKIFLNHPYENGNHSFIIGNIDDKTVSCKMDLSLLEGIDGNWLDAKKNSSLKDGLSGAKFLMDETGALNLELPPYGMLWLK